MKFLAITSIFALASAQCTFPEDTATDAEKLAFRTKLEACRTGYDALPACGTDETATRDATTCCLTCKDTSLTTAEPVCTDAQKKACYERLPTLTECATGVRPTFDPAACCYDCKPVRDDATAPAADGTCTREKYMACMAAAPPCTRDLLESTRDLSLADLKDRCCPICKPPQEADGCTFARAVQNTADLAECADGERPQPVPETCSLSCRPPKPVCATACSDNQVCVRSREGPKCVPRVVRRWRLKAANQVVRALIHKSTRERLTAAAKEIVARKCRRALVAAAGAEDAEKARRIARRCAAFRRRVEDGLDVERTTPADAPETDPVEVRVTVDGTRQDVDLAPAARRLLAEEDAGDLLDEGVGAVDGGDGLTVENVPEKTDDSTSAAGSVAASMITAVAALFVL